MNVKARWLIALAILAVARGAARAQRAPIDDVLAADIDAMARAIDAGFDRDEAMRVVAFMDQFWRLAGNAGFDASQDRIRARLLASGFRARPSAAAPGAPSVAQGFSPASAPLVWFEEYPANGHGWDYERGSLSIAGDTQPVLSRDAERNALCINSFSTPAGGIDAPLVDVGAGRDADFAGKDVKGAVVLGDADVGGLWRSAVLTHGAIGVVSTSLARYVTPDPPGARTPTPREQWNILQWGSIPYDEARRGFGFKATPRAAARLRAQLAAGAVRVHVDIASSFANKPSRTLVAEIPGRTLPDQRIVMAAHVQEPGANDDASGCATLMELARALAQAFEQGRIARPARTLTFLWVDENRGSRQWLADHPSDARQVQRMFSLDMTGEDTSKTGGAFLIEKWPDPSAVWDRPSDPHTEWGKSDVPAASLKGDLLNDLHLTVCKRLARRDGWIVRTNPYEGGSDHTVFGGAGIPSVLNWHFTDRYYHTNLDRPDKVSAVEMQRVAAAVGVSAMLLASGEAKHARAIAGLVTAAGLGRLDLERRQHADAAILDAWTRWYTQAIESARTLPAQADAAVDGVVADGVRRIQQAGGAGVKPGLKPSHARLRYETPPA